MSNLDGKNSLPPDVFRQIDEVCEAFESAWRSGQRPSLRRYVADVQEPARSVLVRELVLLDIEYRRKRGETPAAADYSTELPEHAAAIDAAFTPQPGAGRASQREARVEMPLPSVSQSDQTTSGAVSAGTTPPEGKQAKTTPWTLAQGQGAAPARLGRFEIRARLGAGGFGTVYRAYDTLLDREVALKVPHPARLETEPDRQRALREAKAAGQLRHPAIVPVFDAAADAGQFYIASAFVEGQTLAERISQRPPDFREAARLVMDLAGALDYAHRLGIVHRDVKPGNVLVDASGNALLTDFGLARFLGSEDRLTEDGALLGTPVYMSPEQARGEIDAVGPASDQYSLGVVLYEMLSGQRPFSGTPVNVIAEVVANEPPSPSSIRPGIPRDLETICLKAMSKAPPARYPSCQEMADDLRRWLEGEPIRARRVGPMERAARWCRRNPVVAGLSMATAVLLVAVAAVSSWGYVRTSEALARESDERQRAEQATLRESDERQRAEKATVREAEERRRATAEAERANQSAQKEMAARQTAEAMAYRNAIALAQQMLAKDDAVHASEMLDTCPERLRHWEWGYLKRQCEGIVTLRGITGLQGVAFSSDGKWVGCGHLQSGVVVWNLQTYERLTTRPGRVISLPAEEWAVRCVAFSPDGKRMAVGLARLSVPMSWVPWNEVRVQEITTRKTLLRLAGHSDEALAVAFSPDGKWIASGARDGNAILWKADTGEKVRVFKTVGTSVKTVAFSADSKRLLTAGPRDVRLWRVESGEPSERLSAARIDSPTCAALCPDGHRVALAAGSAIAIVDADNRSTTTALETPAASGPDREKSPSFTSVAFSPSGTQVAAGTDHGAVYVWDARSGKMLLGRAMHDAAVTGVAFTPDGRRLASAGDDKNLRIFPVPPTPSGPPVRVAGVERGFVLSLDGRRILTAEGEVWDTATGKSIAALEKFPEGDSRPLADRHTTLALSADGSLAVLSAEEGGPQLGTWDARTGKRLMHRFGYSSPMALSPDGRRVAAARWSYGGLRICDARSGKETAALAVVAAGSLSGARLLFSPDGRQVALYGKLDLVGQLSDLTRIFDTQTGEMLHTVLGRDMLPVAFSPDGKRLVLRGKTDVVFSLVDAATGENAVPLRGHKKAVLAAAFSPDGARLASTGADGTLRIWDAGSGEELLSIQTPDASYSAVAFVGRAGLRIVGAGAAGTLQFWDGSFPKSSSAGPAKSAKEDASAEAPAWAERERRRATWEAALKTNPNLKALREQFLREGKSVDDLDARLEESLGELPTVPTAHLILGRILLDPGDDARLMAAWLGIFQDGYFVAPAQDLSQPLKLRRHGYRPLDIPLEKFKDPIIDLGDIRMERAPESQKGRLRGKVTKEDVSNRSPAKVTVSVAQDRVLTPSGSYAPRKWAQDVEFSTPPSGEFSAEGFSATDYYLTVSSPSCQDYQKRIAFRPGELLDVGTIALKKAPSGARAQTLSSLSKRPPGRLARQGGAASFTMPDKALWFFRDAQRALVPDGAKLHLSGQMTVEAWIKPDESVAGRKASYVLSKWATGSGFWVRMAGGRQPLELQFGIGDQSFNAPYTPPMDQWTHVALVCDGNEARLLVNGKIVAKPALAAALKANDATFCIGWSVSHEGANWRGMIDEVRLWSAARTPEQIQETMRRRLEGNEPGLVGYWDDEPWRWSPMADLTGNGNDAEFGGSRRSPGKTHPAWAPGAFAEPDAEQKFWENLRKMSQQYGPTSSVDTGKGAPRKPDAPPR